MSLPPGVPSNWLQRPRGCAITLRAVSVALLALLLRPDLSASQPGTVNERARQELAAAIYWVRQTGNATVIRAHIAAAFGLPPRDVPARQRGLRPLGANLTEVFAVPEGLTDTAFISRIDEAAGTAVVWRTTTSGVLKATFAFDAVAGAQEIPSSPDEEALLSTAKAFHVDRLRPDASSPPAVRHPDPTGASPKTDTQLTRPDAAVSRSPRGVLASEISAIAAAPWVLIVISIALYCACRPASRRA